MNVMIAAGGTGGHVFPAVAVAAGLLERGDRVHWIGRPNSLEESEARQLGVPFTGLPLSGLKRRLTLKNLGAILQFWKGRSKARAAMASFQAQVLFALGSYVSAPVISSAVAARIPVVVHEQNVVPGLVVSTYSRKVDRVLLAQPLMDRTLSSATQVVGMPLRPGIVLPREERCFRDLGLDPGKKTLFIFGGSQGAKALCKVGLELGNAWLASRPDWQILLQTGVQNLDWVQAAIRSNNIVPVGHLREMGKAYACAEFIMARSGAVSCAELAAVGKPAILVPYPFASRDHQRKNAEVFAQVHPARILEESLLDVAGIETALEALSGTIPRPLSPEELNAPVRRIIGTLDVVAGRDKK